MEIGANVERVFSSISENNVTDIAELLKEFGHTLTAENVRKKLTLVISQHGAFLLVCRNKADRIVGMGLIAIRAPLLIKRPLLKTLSCVATIAEKALERKLSKN